MATYEKDYMVLLSQLIRYVSVNMGKGVIISNICDSTRAILSDTSLLCLL